MVPIGLLLNLALAAAVVAIVLWREKYVPNGEVIARSLERMEEVISYLEERTGAVSASDRGNLAPGIGNPAKPGSGREVGNRIFPGC